MAGDFEIDTVLPPSTRTGAMPVWEEKHSQETENDVDGFVVLEAPRTEPTLVQILFEWPPREGGWWRAMPYKTYSDMRQLQRPSCKAFMTEMVSNGKFWQ